MARLPQRHRDAAARIVVPSDLDIPAPRAVPEFLKEHKKLNGPMLIANFMQGISSRAMDPGRWWWQANDAMKLNPFNEVSNAKQLIKAAIADLCKATRSAKKKAGLLRLPSGQGQVPVPHPTRELGWVVCVHAPDKGGSLYFPHAGIILRLAPGDAMLFPLAGGFGIAPIKEGYSFLMCSHEPPVPRLVLPWGSAA